MEPQPAVPLFRRLLLAAGALALAAGVAWQLNGLFRGALHAPLDFAEYWTAGRLNAAGGNPYSAASVRAVQRGLGIDDRAVMMWNPPWALTLVMPVGAVPFRAAYGAWVLLNLGLLVASAELLWRGFGGPPRLRWVAHLAALTFGPTVFLIGAGQITAVVLFGLAGFLYFVRNDRPVLAGACAALTAVKPHLLGVFALWLVLEATRSAAGRKVLLGGALVGLAACVPPTLANPDVWAQYAETARGASNADHRHLADWNPPVVGSLLRRALPGEPFAAQWVPLGFALVGFAAWWGKQGPDPRWADRLPWVVGLSVLAAPYGAWAFDLVLLLVPVLAAAAAAARSRNPAAIATGLIALACVNAASLVMLTQRASGERYVWVTPAVLLGCLAAARLAGPRPVAAPAPAGA